MIIRQYKHCGQNDHRRESFALCPFFEGRLYSRTGTRTISDDQLPVVDEEPANTPQNVICASSGVASAGLHDRANRANQMEASNSCNPIILYM